MFYTDPVEAKPQDQTAALKELVGDMNAGKVDLLLIVGGNPVYDAPADLKFADAMDKVQLRVQHSALPGRDDRLSCTGTSTPRTTWSSGAMCARSTERSSLIQPLIAPLYDGKSEYEFVEALDRIRRRRPATTLSASTGRAR